VVAIERVLPPLGVALAALARHENQRYAHYPSRPTGNGPVRRGVLWSAGWTKLDVLILEQSFSSFGIEMVDLHSPTTPTIARKEAARTAREPAIRSLLLQTNRWW
jgi:hypothetical protein